MATAPPRRASVAWRWLTREASSGKAGGMQQTGDCGVISFLRLLRPTFMGCAPRVSGVVWWVAEQRACLCGLVPFETLAGAGVPAWPGRCACGCEGGTGAADTVTQAWQVRSCLIACVLWEAGGG